ncbi:MAG: O-methyltransferase [Porphyromonas sp.]|nr:O-methyltransferase [Porphyromonas sp.]
MRKRKDTYQIEDRLRALTSDEYIAEHSSPEPKLLQEVRSHADVRLVHPRMISGHLQGRLLKMLVQMIKPSHVLELGTYSAYATVCLAEGLPQGGRVTTVEANDELESLIRNIVEEAGLSESIEVIIGDAMEVIHKLQLDDVRLVFLDADKQHYPEYYDLLIDRLPPDSYIIADNTLWSGKVYDENIHDPQTDGIRRFNELVKGDKRVEQILLPLRDGLTIIHKW